MSVEQIRIEREHREAVAAERAATLPKRDYHASDNFVAYFDNGEHRVLECESHWDACLVLLAKGK